MSSGGPAATAKTAVSFITSHSPQRGTFLRVAFGIGLLVWPLLHQSQYGLSVMATAGIYALLTISVSLVIGHAGQLSFGHAAFFGIGAYTTSLLIMRLHLPTLLAFFLGAVAAGLVALVIGRPVLRLRYFYLALATIGLGQILVVMVTQLRGVTGGQNGLAPIPQFHILGFTADTYVRKYYLVWFVVLAVVLFSQRALNHRTGRSLRALATSEIAASTLGVRTASWKMLAFVVSAIFCGAAGGLLAFNNGAITPDSFSFNAAVLPVIMMLIGGMESLWGSLIGAIILTWALNTFSGMAQYSGLIYSFVLVLLLLFLPNGVFQGAKRVWRRRPADVRATPAIAGEAHIWCPTASADAGGAPAGTPLLMIHDISVDFGGLRAVNHVSLTVHQGQIASVIGPNGAGKTTLFNVISHLQRPTTGNVEFGDTVTTRMVTSDVARLGIARTFQNLRVFGNMNVLENVLVGCHRHERSGIISDGLGLPKERREERDSTSRALEALALVGLEQQARQPIAGLPYGQQRLVEIARALASEPRLLLLDEPAAGMNTAERVSLVDKIARIRDAGVTVVLVEHDIELVMGISDTVAVLDHGSLIATGRPETVRQEPAVIEAYLGVQRADRHLTAVKVAEERQPGEEMPTPMLVVEGISTFYGQIQALRGVSLRVAEGETVVVIGANGAGKTTLLRTISGILTPRAGRITFLGHHTTRLAAPAVTALGVCHVFEGRQLFPTLSVEDNLAVGTANRRRRDGFADDLAMVFDLFPLLADRRKQRAGSLSGGEQQMLAIGRALMGHPRLLLLDEPSMGLAPLVVENIFSTLNDLNSKGLTILMVEQNAELALEMAHHALVLQTGEVALAGTAEELRRDERVRECYLGHT